MIRDVGKSRDFRAVGVKATGGHPVTKAEGFSMAIQTGKSMPGAGIQFNVVVGCINPATLPTTSTSDLTVGLGCSSWGSACPRLWLHHFELGSHHELGALLWEGSALVDRDCRTVWPWPWVKPLYKDRHWSATHTHSIHPDQTCSCKMQINRHVSIVNHVPCIY